MKRVFVKNDADWFGSGEFYFTATVDGKPVGDKKQIFDAREGQWIDLPIAKWSAEVDVTNKTKVVVWFNGKDQDFFSDDDLGTVNRYLAPPWTERTFRHDTEFFTLEWSVELLVDGNFGHHAPAEVFACRTVAGSTSCTTVSGVPIIARLEIHPVRPVPPTGLPPRGLPAGPSLAVLTGGGTTIASGDPINIVPNPAVIPILTAPGGAAPAAGAPPLADATTAARIEVTYYRPNTLNFTSNDPRLEWTVRPLAGGAVSFLGPPQGLNVMVYGTAAGEVALEVKFRGELMATFRALVLPIKQIPCRFNILNGPAAASRPRATPANVQDHLAIANRYLRQIALELVLDSNVTVKDGAHASPIPGIFRISVAAGRTRNINSNVANLVATRLNYRPKVMNFAYVHSATGGVLGAATDFPPSGVAAAAGTRPSITETGTPSASWIIPTGVPPDAAAGAVTLQLIRGIQRPGHPQLFAMFVTDSHGDPSIPAIQLNYANTIVHEFLHILNLGHRVEGPDPATATGLAANGIFWDGLLHPPNENIMHWNAPGNIAQDIDTIQARGARQSPLVPP
ncbi:MAG TPA: hypothetical protein VGP07_26945 [Polyangia bacterium]